MKAVQFITFALILGFTIKPLGVIPAMILSGVVYMVIGLFISQSEINEIEAKATQNNIPGPSSPTNHDQPYFLVSGEKLSPREFGSWVVKVSSQSSINSVQSILELGSTQQSDGNIFNHIKLRPFVAQFHIMALHIGSYYAYALALLNVPHNDMAEVYAGFKDSIDDWLKSESSYADSFEQLLRIYSEAVFTELQTPIEDVGFMVTGPVANLVTEKVLLSYAEFNDIKPVDVSPIEKLMIGTAIQSSVIAGILSLFNQLHITYSNK